MTHTVEARLTPSWLSDTWATVESVDEILPMIARLQAAAEAGPGFLGYPDLAETPSALS